MPNNHKPQSLLPTDTAADRPLFVVLAILAFLASLTLLSVKTSYQAAEQWGVDLKETATIQIKPTSTSGTAQQAKSILETLPFIQNAEILSKEYSKELLKPWLGEAPLPDDLPLPILLHVQLRKGQALDIESMQSQLALAGIEADIDDHSYWSKDLQKGTRAVQTLSSFALILIGVAIFSACIFATHAGIERRKQLMDVLHQIGASPSYTARLFSTRFALTNFKAGLLGACGAFLILLVFSLMSGGNENGRHYFLPGFDISLSDFYLALLVPLCMAIISGLTAWRTVMQSLLAQIYP